MSKPTPQEVKRLIMREAETRIALQQARARAHLRLLRRDEKATYHQCRAYAIAATVTRYQAYEQARADLITAAYAINGTLQLDTSEHTFGVAG